MDFKHVEMEARFESVRLAQRIADEANKRPEGERAAFAGVCASMVLQTVVTSMAVQLFPPGSAEGARFLTVTYENALKDAIERWHKGDLKERFPHPGRG